MKLLFVCTGNTCRSPMAAEIARRVAAERGLADVTVASAGTGAKAGRPGGLYTLVLRKKPEGWRIVHDHTSAAPDK